VVHHPGQQHVLSLLRTHNAVPGFPELATGGLGDEYNDEPVLAVFVLADSLERVFRDRPVGIIGRVCGAPVDGRLEVLFYHSLANFKYLTGWKDEE
jgi:hypothetical protein